MPCAESERTSAYVDGELEPREIPDAERHLQGCPDCQALAVVAADVSDALRRPAGRSACPPGLRRAIGRALDAEERSMARPRPTPRRAPFLWGAFSGIGASAAVAAAVLLVLMPPRPDTVAGSLVDAHIRALAAGRTIQVVSSDHHTVKPWFAGRTPLSPPVVDLALQGFPLAGGRVDRIAGARAAVVVYRRGLHEIDLFVWPVRRGMPPAAAERLGYRVVGWRSGDLALAAVSDVQPDELHAFARLAGSPPE